MKPLTEENYSLQELEGRKVWIRPGFNPLVDDDDQRRAVRATKLLTNKCVTIDEMDAHNVKSISSKRVRIVIHGLTEDLDEEEDGVAWNEEDTQVWIVNLEDLSFNPWIKPLSYTQKADLETLVERLSKIGD